MKFFDNTQDLIFGSNESVPPVSDVYGDGYEPFGPIANDQPVLSEGALPQGFNVATTLDPLGTLTEIPTASSLTGNYPKQTRNVDTSYSGNSQPDDNIMPAENADFSINVPLGVSPQRNVDNRIQEYLDFNSPLDGGSHSSQRDSTSDSPGKVPLPLDSSPFSIYSSSMPLDEHRRVTSAEHLVSADSVADNNPFRQSRSSKTQPSPFYDSPSGVSGGQFSPNPNLVIDPFANFVPESAGLATKMNQASLSPKEIGALSSFEITSPTFIPFKASAPASSSSRLPEKILVLQSADGNGLEIKAACMSVPINPL